MRRSGPVRGGVPVRVIAEFRKEGPARYISHLDLMRVMQRALRRADIPVVYSQGFNPHALISFATALPVGCSSECEIMDLRIEDGFGWGDLASRLNTALPDGLSVIRATRTSAEAPAPMAAVQAASYEVYASGDWPAKAKEFLASAGWPAAKRGKKGVRDVDIRPMVYALEPDGDGRRFTCVLRHDGALALKPSLLAQALGIEGESAHRTGLLLRGGDGWTPLYGLYEGGA